MDLASHRFRSIRHPDGRKIKGIEARDGNSVWVGTVQPGEKTTRMEIYDGRQFLRVPGGDAIPTIDVRAVLRARNGVIWVGGPVISFGL